MKTTHFVWYEHTKNINTGHIYKIMHYSFGIQKSEKTGVIFDGKKTAMGISHRFAQNVCPSIKLSFPTRIHPRLLP